MASAHNKSSIFTVDDKRNVLKTLEKISNRQRFLIQRSKRNDLNQNQCLDSCESEYDSESDDTFPTGETSPSSSFEILNEPRSKSFKKYTNQNASERRAKKKKEIKKPTYRNVDVSNHQKNEKNIQKDDSNGNFLNNMSKAICSMNDAVSNLSKPFGSLKHDLMSCQPYLDMSTKTQFTLQSLPSFPIGSGSTQFKFKENVVHLVIKTVDEVKLLNSILKDTALYEEIVSVDGTAA